MQMPFDNTSTDIPIRISKQYYALMQVCNFMQQAPCWLHMTPLTVRCVAASAAVHQQACKVCIVGFCAFPTCAWASVLSFMVESAVFASQSGHIVSQLLMQPVLLSGCLRCGLLAHMAAKTCHKYMLDMYIKCCLCCSIVSHALPLVLQYSKFIKNGWTILDTSQDERTLAAMYQHQDSSTEMAVVTTNTDTSSSATNWDFGSTSPLQYVLELYRTSASENFTRLPDLLLPMSGHLQYELPAQSITTFHFTYVAAAALATAG